MSKTAAPKYWEKQQLSNWIDRLCEGESQLCRQRRQQYLATFSSLPWPSRQNEAWRYLPIQRLVNKPYQLHVDTDDMEFSILESDGSYDFVFSMACFKLSWAASIITSRAGC